MLEAKEISVSYGNKSIINRLSVSLPMGQTTAIIGTNGSGKSTLLKALARLHPLSHGEIVLDGRDIQSYQTTEVAKRLAILPQSARAPEGMTVLDLVSLGRFPHQKLTQLHLSSEDYALIREVMTITNVWELRDVAVDQLSGGQRQRVWIALVLAQDSDIILLDEPTTYLDIVHQYEILSLLKDLVENHGKTVVYVLHELNQVARFSDYLIVMQEGKILTEGMTQKVFDEKMIESAFKVKVSIGTDSFSQTPMIVGVDY